MEIKNKILMSVEDEILTKICERPMKEWRLIFQEEKRPWSLTAAEKVGMSNTPIIFLALRQIDRLKGVDSSQNITWAGISALLSELIVQGSNNVSEEVWVALFKAAARGFELHRNGEDGAVDAMHNLFLLLLPKDSSERQQWMNKVLDYLAIAPQVIRKEKSIIQLIKMGLDKDDVGNFFWDDNTGPTMRTVASLTILTASENNYLIELTNEELDYCFLRSIWVEEEARTARKNYVAAEGVSEINKAYKVYVDEMEARGITNQEIVWKVASASMRSVESLEKTISRVKAVSLRNMSGYKYLDWSLRGKDGESLLQHMVMHGGGVLERMKEISPEEFEKLPKDELKHVDKNGIGLLGYELAGMASETRKFDGLNVEWKLACRMVGESQIVNYAAEWIKNEKDALLILNKLNSCKDRFGKRSAVFNEMDPGRMDQLSKVESRDELLSGIAQSAINTKNWHWMRSSLAEMNIKNINSINANWFLGRELFRLSEMDCLPFDFDENNSFRKSKLIINSAIENGASWSSWQEMLKSGEALRHYQKILDFSSMLTDLVENFEKKFWFEEMKVKSERLSLLKDNQIVTENQKAIKQTAL